MASAPSALIVEDDHDLGPTIHEILDAGGYDTTLVRTVEEARAALSQALFDVVVLDVMLGPGNARELLAEFAASADPPPTLLVSAAREAPRLAEDYGVPLVAKPFDLDAFLEAVARVRREGPPRSSQVRAV